MKFDFRKKRSGTGPSLRWLFIVIGSLILGIYIYLWNGYQLVGNKLPMPLGYGMAVIRSGSMEDTLSIDDLVLVHRQKEYEVGDIVVYQSDGDLVIHRVIEMEGDKLITQGDANLVPDAPVRFSAVKGKMIGHIPGIGAVVRRLKTPVGVVLTLAAAVLLLELSYRKDGSEEEQEQEKLREEIARLKSALHKGDEGM